jgi:hypothetical protein
MVKKKNNRVSKKKKKGERTKEVPLKKRIVNEIKKNKKEFRLQCKKLYLTFPKENLSKEQMLSNLKEMFSEYEIEWIVVCQEKHKDGDKHLHCIIILKNKVRITAKKLDTLTGKRGNYQNCKVPHKCLEYIIKDGNYIKYPESFDVKKFLKARKSKKSPKADVVAKLLIDGKNLKEVNDLLPGFTMMNLAKIRQYISFLDSNKQEKKLKWNGWKDIVYNTEEKTIMKWFEENILLRKGARNFSSLNLMIIGKTQRGKTTLMRNMEKYIKVYWVPMDEDFYDGYSDDFDVCVFEEFKSQKRIQFMNRFIDGNCWLRIKGAQVFRRKPTPVVILSNYYLNECYPKVFDSKPGVIDALERRLEIVKVDSFIKCEGK